MTDFLAGSSFVQCFFSHPQRCLQPCCKQLSSISNKMILHSITASLLLLSFSLDAASAVSSTGCSAINTCSRGGASIDGERNKRFSYRLKPQINRTSVTSQLERRDVSNINSKRNESISNDSKSIGSGKSIATSSPQKSKKFKMYVTCISIVFSWLSLSTLFYAKFYDWPYPQVSNYTKCLHCACCSWTEVVNADARC